MTAVELQHSAAASFTTTRSYDVFDRLASETDRYGNPLQFVYDLSGNRLSRIDTTGTTSTVPDALNRIIQVTPPNGDTTQTIYTPAGRVQSVTTPSGLVSTTSYDPAGRIVTHKQNAAPVASYAYGYDANGNRIEQDETNGGLTEVTTYGYDDDDRLTDVTYPDRTAHYDLDGVGNRTQETQTDASSHAQIKQVTATFNTRDQLTQLADTTAATINYSYDANGNISTKSQSGQVTTYRNNAQDRLATLSLQGAPPSQASSYDYDASGMRVAKTTNGNTTHYRYDQQSLIQETNTLGNLLARYDYSADRQLAEVRNSNTNYFLHDALKSPIAQVTSQGAIAMRAQYDAWGLLRTESGTNTQAFGFTGYQRDRESGLYYAKARYYDPATARFNSEDPEEGKAQTPPSLHRYLYAYANPTVYVDPTGNASVSTMIDDSAAGCGVITCALYALEYAGYQVATAGFAAVHDPVRDAYDTGKVTGTTYVTHGIGGGLAVAGVSLATARIGGGLVAGVTTTAGRVGGAAAVGAATGAAADAATQGVHISAGIQSDYDSARTGKAALTGAAFGGGSVALAEGGIAARQALSSRGVVSSETSAGLDVLLDAMQPKIGVPEPVVVTEGTTGDVAATQSQAAIPDYIAQQVAKLPPDSVRVLGVEGRRGQGFTGDLAAKVEALQPISGVRFSGGNSKARGPFVAFGELSDNMKTAREQMAFKKFGRGMYNPMSERIDVTVKPGATFYLGEAAEQVSRAGRRYSGGATQGYLEYWQPENEGLIDYGNPMKLRDLNQHGDSQQ